MRINKFAGIAASTFFSGALVIGMATTAAAAPDLGSLGGSLGGLDGCGLIVSTPDATGGWAAPADEHAATYGAVDPASPLGEDALILEAHADGTSWYKASGVQLSSLLNADGTPTAIAYDYLSDGQAPALQLRITGANYANDSDGFATIVWSPEAGDGTWKTATPGESDQFWVTRAIDGVEGVREGADLPRGEMTTLANIIKMNPDATLVEYGVQRTKGNDAGTVAVDSFTFGCATTNFETVAPAADPFGSLTDLFAGLL